MKNRYAAALVAVVLAGGAAVLWTRRPPPPNAALPGRPPSGPSATAAGPTGKPTTVLVYDDGAPNPDRWVVFHDANGAVLASAKSDAQGKASADVPAGSLVTVAYGTSVQHLVTVMGVVPGESIVIGEAEDEGGPGRTVTTARVKLPGPFAGAKRHVVTLGVGQAEVPDASAPMPMPVLRRFVDQDRFRVLAEALSPDDEPLAFAFAWGEVARADAGAVAVPLAAWSTTYRPWNIVLEHGPSVPASVRAELAILTGKDVRFERRTRPSKLDRDTVLRFRVPEPLGDDASYRVEIAWDGSPDRTVLARRKRGAPPIRVDLASELLPRVSGAAVERSDDPARPVVRWSVAGDTSACDATIVRLSWPPTGEHVWTVVAPPSHPARLRVPVLPPPLAEWRPDGRPAVASVAILESSEYAGYDEVRRKGIDAAAEGVNEDDDGSLRWSATGDLAF